MRDLLKSRADARVDLVKGSGGVFEITVDGDLHHVIARKLFALQSAKHGLRPFGKGLSKSSIAWKFHDPHLAELIRAEVCAEVVEGTLHTLHQTEC